MKAANAVYGHNVLRAQVTEFPKAYSGIQGGGNETDITAQRGCGARPLGCGKLGQFAVCPISTVNLLGCRSTPPMDYGLRSRVAQDAPRGLRGGRNSF